MRPPFDAEEPTRRGERARFLTADDADLLMRGNPLMSGYVKSTEWGRSGDVMSYHPSTGYLWERIKKECWRTDNQRDERVATDKAPPSAAALALATAADWQQVAEQADPWDAVRDHYKWIRAVSLREYDAVMKAAFSRATASNISGQVADGGATPDWLLYTPRRKLGWVARHLREVVDGWSSKPADIQRAQAALRRIACSQSAPRPPRRRTSKPPPSPQAPAGPRPAYMQLDLTGMTPAEMVHAIHKAAEEEERVAGAASAGIDTGTPPAPNRDSPARGESPEPSGPSEPLANGFGV